MVDGGGMLKVKLGIGVCDVRIASSAGYISAGTLSRDSVTHPNANSTSILSKVQIPSNSIPQSKSRFPPTP